VIDGSKAHTLSSMACHRLRGSKGSWKVISLFFFSDASTLSIDVLKLFMVRNFGYPIVPLSQKVLYS